MASNNDDSRAPIQRHPQRPLAFLLAQVGAHAAEKFAQRLAPLGLTPGQAALMRIISKSAGLSQQALCSQMAVVPSRLVVVIDELEKRDLVERRDHPDDRRSYALYLTKLGTEVLAKVRKIASEHEDSLCSSLNLEERIQLASLLSRLSSEQGLIPGVHPGFNQPPQNK